MTTYTVKGPDGHTYTLQGPADATPDQLAQALGAQQQSPAGPPAPEGALMTGIRTGLDSATFGAGNKLSALLTTALSHVVPGVKTQSYDEALGGINAQQQADTAAHPIAAVGGEVAGALGTGAGLGKGALKIAEHVAPEATAKVASALALKSGEPIKNLLRLAGLGSLTGATFGGAQGFVQGATDTGSPLEAAKQGFEGVGTGAVLGAPFGVAAAAVPKAATALKDTFSGPSNRALNLLSKYVDLAPDQLRKMITDFKNSTGRNATIADILDAKSTANVAPFTSAFQSSAARMQDAADTALEQLPKNVSTQITKSGSTETPFVDTKGNQVNFSTARMSRLVQAQSTAMDQAMAPIRNRSITLTPEDEQLLTHPLVRKAIAGDPVLRQKFAMARDLLQPARDEQGNIIPDLLGGEYADNMNVGDFERLRRTLRGAQDQALNPAAGRAYNPAVAQDYKNLAGAFNELATNQVPEYGHALESYAQQQRFINGFEHGQAGRSALDAKNSGDIATFSTPEGRAGLEVGARSRLADAAGKSESGAKATINQLRQSSETPTTESIPIPQVTKMQDMARAETRSQQNFGALASGQLKSRAEEATQGIRSAAEVGTAAAGHTTTGFGFHAVWRFLRGAGVRESTANAIVSAITDPAEAAKLPDLLKSARLTAAQRQKVLQIAAHRAGLVGGRTGGVLTNQANQGQ